MENGMRLGRSPRRGMAGGARLAPPRRAGAYDGRMRHYSRIHTDVHRSRAKITLAYPKRRNAIGPQMTSELLYALEDAVADDAVRVIVLTGEGDVFSAGGDFAQMPVAGESKRPPPAGAEALPQKGDYADLIMALVRCEKPVIARVNGHAFGGGLGLVAASTFSVALKSAQLGTPEVNVGLFPMMVMSLLSRCVPRRRLLEMMLFGDRMEAREAELIGLIGRAVDPGDLDEAVRDIETKLVKKSPIALRNGLRAWAAQQDMELSRALPLMRERLAECLATEDAREGLLAFMEKREPVWTGR
jgi:enoyl-CoA hydratase/carnithine racemase